MSASPVRALRTLQAIIQRLTQVEVPLLDLTRALANHMNRPALILPRASMLIYHDRLRNWRMVDQLVITRFHAIRRERRATAAEFQEIYAIYKAEAEAHGLQPLEYPSFRVRAYSIPILRQKPQIATSEGIR